MKEIILSDHRLFPFVNWKTCDQEFILLKQSWDNLVESVLSKGSLEWVQEFNSDRGGNPLVTLVNYENQRGVRVIVNIEEDDETPVNEGLNLNIYPYLNHSFLQDGETPIIEIVLLVNTKEAAYGDAVPFIVEHCLNFSSETILEKMCSTYEKTN